MPIFEELHRNRSENLHFVQHRESGLYGVIAIHDSSLGPAIGGISFRDYPDESTLVHDALRLAEHTSLASATFGCSAGGGRALIWCAPEQKTDFMVRALGAFIDSLGGRFIATLDLGMTPQDLALVGRETHFVAGIPRNEAEEGLPTRLVARGVFLGIKAAAKAALGVSSLEGLKIGIQGLGKIGRAVLEMVAAEKAFPSITDLSFERVKIARDRFRGAEMIPHEAFLREPFDILVPCAWGGILTREVVENLRCRVIAGSASGLLAEDSLAKRLHERNILYIPEFVTNSGDLLLAEADLTHIYRGSCTARVEAVFYRVESLISKAAESGRTPWEVAREEAHEQMKQVQSLKKIYRPRK